MAKQKRLGELLLDAGLINEGQLRGALERQKKWGGRFGENLILNNSITEDQLLRFFAARTGIEELDISGVQILPHIIKKVPAKLVEKHHIIPVAMKDKNTLMVAVSDPMDFEAMDQVRFTTGLKVEPVLSSYSAIANAIDKFYYDGRGVYKGNKKRQQTGPRMVQAESMERHGGHEASDDPDLIIFGQQQEESSSRPKTPLVDISDNYKPRVDSGEFDDGYPDLDKTVSDSAMPVDSMPGLNQPATQSLDLDTSLPDVPQPGSVPPKPKSARPGSGQPGSGQPGSGQPGSGQPASRKQAQPKPGAESIGSVRSAGQGQGKKPVTTDEKFRALYNALIRKGVITQEEMMAELKLLRKPPSR